MPTMKIEIKLSEDAKRLLDAFSKSRDASTTEPKAAEPPLGVGDVVCWIKNPRIIGDVDRWPDGRLFVWDRPPSHPPIPNFEIHKWRRIPIAERNVPPVGEGKDFPGNGKAPKEEDRLIDCVDCQVFAREFNRRNPSIDEGYLLGWFATAIENGKSAGRREAAAKESKSSDHAAYTAGYHASAPTNSDGKTSSPPGVKSAAGPSLNIKIGLFPGDFVLHLPTGSAMEITASTSDERSTALVDGALFNDWTTNFKKIPRETHRILVAKQRAAQELREALGLLTTLAPKMVIDPDHPMKMAQEIVKVVNEERKTRTGDEEFLRRFRSIVEGTAFVLSPGPTSKS